MNLPWLEPVEQQVERGLVAGRLPHGLLLCGPAGVGKSRYSRRLAARLLCLEPAAGRACGQCRSCQLVAAGSHPDYRLIAPEGPGGQILVDEVRGMIDMLHLTPSVGTRRVALILAAERMNRSAANALLKTLEEPAGNVWLILVSDRPGWLPATIRSRCMQLAIALPDPATAADWLAETRAPDVADEDESPPEPDERSPENLELALRLAGGAPLLAADLLDRGQVSQAAGLLGDLLAFEAGQKPAAELVSQWKAEAGQAFEWLARWCAQALRLQALGQAETDSTDLARLARIPGQRLHAGYRYSLECRRLTETPVRKDLLLTDWLARWFTPAA